MDGRFQKKNVRIFTDPHLQEALIADPGGNILARITLQASSGEGGGGTLIITDMTDK